MERKQTMLENVIQARKDFFNNVNVDSSSLNDLAEEIANVKKLRKYLDEVDDELKVSWKALVVKALEAMDNQDIETFTTGEGVKITKDFQIRGKVNNSVEFFKWLEKRGDTELGKLQLSPEIVSDEIKEIVRNADPENVNMLVHWKKMASYVDEVCDVLDAKTWPDGVTIEAWPDIKVKY